MALGATTERAGLKGEVVRFDNLKEIRFRGNYFKLFLFLFLFFSWWASQLFISWITWGVGIRVYASFSARMTTKYLNIQEWIEVFVSDIPPRE